MDGPYPRQVIERLLKHRLYNPYCNKHSPTVPLKVIHMDPSMDLCTVRQVFQIRLFICLGWV
jgi:hypothetical protein